MDEHRRYTQYRKRKKRRFIIILCKAFLMTAIIYCDIALFKFAAGIIHSDLMNQGSAYDLKEESDKKQEKVYDLDSNQDELGRQLENIALQNPEIKVILDNREDYPDEILTLLVNNLETTQFVLDYPDKKDDEISIDVSGEVKEGEVPLFLQWDERWGYSMYDNEIMAIDGCGPTCLSMVAVYVLGDTTMNPYWMAEYSEANGYVDSGSTLWSLMSEGASLLGLDVTEIPLDEKRVADNLKAGNPIICIMGPGDFTSSGHFIVLTGYEDGMITVNDPNSIERSNKRWSFSEISSQIRNLWAYRVRK
jgi:hypothetical protein